MDPLTTEMRLHGGLFFSALGFGTAPLGNLGRVLSEEEAQATLRAAWNIGVTYYDTAPLYGHGLSENRLKPLFAAQPREGFVVSTKVGRVLEACEPGEFGCTKFEIGDVNALGAEAHEGAQSRFIGARCDTKPTDIADGEHKCRNVGQDRIGRGLELESRCPAREVVDPGDR